MIRLSKSRKLKIIKDNIEPYIPYSLSTITFIKVDINELCETLLSSVNKCYELFPLYIIDEENIHDYVSEYEDQINELENTIVYIFNIFYSIDTSKIYSTYKKYTEAYEIRYKIIDNLYTFQLKKIKKYYLHILSKYLCKDVLTVMNEYI